MSSRWLLLLAFAALLLSTALFLTFAPEAAALPEPDIRTIAEPPPAVAADGNARSAAATDTSFALRLAAGLTGRQQEPLVAASPGEGTAAVLQGRVAVRQKPWQALADIEVMLTQSWLDTVVPSEPGDADEPLPPLRGPSTRTDAEGRFTLRFVPPAHELFFLIGRGSIWTDFQKVERLPRAGETQDLGDVLVDDRGTASGRALDWDGKPLANVEVRGVDNPLLDADLDSIELRRERTRGLEYFRANGFVDGQPLPRWVAQRDRLLPFPRTLTDANGGFVLAGLRQGVHDLFLQNRDAAGSRFGVSIAGGVRTVLGDIHLLVGEAQQVQVLHQDHKTPWVGARVTAVPHDFAFTPPGTGTDFEGKAMLRGLDADCGYSLLFQYPQGGSCIRLGAFEIEPGQTPVFEVPEPLPVTLLLTDGGGGPVADASVSLLLTGGALRPQDTLLPRWFQPVEEARGRFRARRPGGKVLALATAPGFAPAIAVVGSSTTAIAMQRGIEVRVRCVDRNGGKVPGASVAAQVHDATDQAPGAQWSALANARVWLGRSDADGELLLSGLWPTRMTFAAEHPAYVRSPAATLMPQAGMQVTLVLRQRSAIRGVVTMDELPVGKGMRVMLTSAFGAQHEMHGNPFLTPQTAVTGQDGSFEFRDLVTGVYELRPLLPRQGRDDDESEVRKNRYQPTRVVLDERQEMFVQLEATRRFAALPTLVGKVAFDAVGIPGALVRVRHVIDQDELASWLNTRDPRWREYLLARYAPERLGPDPWLLRTHTDGFGNYAFEDLDEGKWEVRIDVPCQGRFQFLQQAIIEVAPPQHGDATHFDVSVPTGSVRLWIIGPDNQTVPGRMVTLQMVAAAGSCEPCYELLTDNRGCIELDNLPAGCWLLAPASHAEHFVAPELLVCRRDHAEGSFVLAR